jgi:hypothetical protein
MKGIPVERGVWMTEGYGSMPKRLTSNAALTGAEGVRVEGTVMQQED